MQPAAGQAKSSFRRQQSQIVLTNTDEVHCFSNAIIQKKRKQIRTISLLTCCLCCHPMANQNSLETTYMRHFCVQQQNSTCVSAQLAPTVKIVPPSPQKADEKPPQQRTSTDESTVVASQAVKSGTAKKVVKLDKGKVTGDKTAASIKSARELGSQSEARSDAAPAAVSMQARAEARRQPRTARTRVAVPASLGDPAFIKATPVKRIDPEILECVYRVSVSVF